MKRNATQRGRKRNIIPTEWNSDFAYVIGLLATDGNLSPDLRHISFTSQDKELALLYKNILKLKNVIGKKARGGSKEKKYYVVQFGSIQFYDFLLSLGLTPKKSKTISALKVPELFFWHFLRGCIDGDGNINEFSHPESQYLQLRISLASASKNFLVWNRGMIQRLGNIEGGWISSVPYKSVFSLTFGKQDSIKILKKMYPQSCHSFLKRKHKIAQKYLLT